MKRAPSRCCPKFGACGASAYADCDAHPVLQHLGLPYVQHGVLGELSESGVTLVPVRAAPRAIVAVAAAAAEAASWGLPWSDRARIRIARS